MASDQQFCLRWNNHQSTLVSVFDNLLESQTLVDCTLAADGQYLKAHKVVLSACSPYLEAILCQNLDKHPILILKDVKFSELKAMLDYMYRGEVNISQEQLSTFLKAAESLQIKGLTDSGGGGSSDRDPLKRQDLRKPLNQPVPHIPQPRPVVPHPGLMERRSLPHFPPHIADMQPQSPRHAREGSTSPTARKRRRPNRPSSDDSNFISTPNSLSENQPDTSDSCDVPVKQAASSTPNVPNATTKAPETDSNRTTPQPQNNQQNSEQKQQVTVKKEFSEALLTPKTEFDYGNDNSMEDVTYEDDEEEEVDLSKPGTSFAANSQGFPPWQMGGDGSNDDSNNMYSPDVTAATNQNNSQDKKKMKILKNLPKSRRFFEKNNSQGVTLTRHELRPSQDTKHSLDLKLEKQCNSSSCEKSLEERQNSLNKASRLRGKRVICSKCGEYILKRVIRLHKKYYCGRKFDEKEWKLSSSLGLCLRCNKGQEPDSIEFHVKYMCGKNPITVQCFYCPRLFEDYKFLLKHMNTGHKKRHCFLDLISVLPVAESTDTENTVPKVVKNFFSNMLNTEHEAVVEDNDASISPCVQLRNKAIHKCNTCGKVLVGTHEYVNHVNTKCESENQYPCFYCDFRSVLAYEVLDHMEETHEKQFNTFDIIQARLTGIIPLIDPNVIDKTSNQSNSPGSKKVHFPEQVIEKIGEKVPKHELEITFKPDLKKAREHVKDVYMVSNEDAELINDKDRILRRGRLFHKDLNVEDKHAEFEIYSSSGEDVLTETGVNLRKQCKSANTGLNLKGQQIIQLDKVSEEDKPPEKSPISIADKENLAKSGNHSSDDHLFEIPPPFDPKELPSNTLVCDSSCSFEKDHKLNSKGSLGQLLYDEPLPQGEVENMEDKSTVEKPLSLIGCTSQEMCETESISQTDQSPNTYPAIAYPQLDFANKQLFVSNCSPARGLRSKSKQMAILKDKHTFEVRLSTEKNNSLKNEAGECMSSDSEVDFANKELFEPYLSPIKKRKKLTKVQSLRKGVRLSTSYSGQTSSDRAGKKETSPSMEIKSYASYSTNQTQKRNTKKVNNSSLKAKVGLKVTKRKMLINKKIIIATANKRKRCPITKINCSKCHEDVHPGDLRIHYKYHCLKHPTKKQWILCSGKALCLRCRKFQWSDSIDFHVKYLCNRKRFLLKCFYCSKIGKDYKSVIVHMHKAHGKKHYYQDLMSILPDSEVGSAEKTQIIKGEDKNSSKVIKHPITFHAVNKNDEGNNKELVDNLTDHSDDYYECFYCEFKHMMAYKTLDHMEDKHCKVHNLYDLLHAKMPQIEPEKGLLS